MARPLISITTYGRDASGRFSLPACYVDAVRRAGGSALLLAPGDDCALAALYGGKRHPTVYMTDSERDDTELALIRTAIERGLPTLCICRGLQVLNVALGGTLVPHLPDRVGLRVAHRVPPRNPAWHGVDVEPDTRLADIIGPHPTSGASWHHQAVDRLGRGLRVTARAPDGTIEAVELPDHPFLVAVQWHPEITARDHPDHQALFDALVAAAQDTEIA